MLESFEILLNSIQKDAIMSVLFFLFYFYFLFMGGWVVGLLEASWGTNLFLIWGLMCSIL